MRYAALVRGINVGGNSQVPMAQLVAMFEALDCAAVSTYVNSGNVVFDAPATIARKVPAAISAAIATQHGFAPAIVLRTAAELAAVARATPFPGDVGKLLHVAFLAGAPNRKKLPALEAACAAGEQLALRGKNLYLYLPGGAGRSRLSAPAIENKLGTIATMRNWNTVLKLVELTAQSR